MILQTLEIENYRGLKLKDQTRQIAEGIIDKLTRQQVDTVMQFGFMPG